MGFFNHQPWYWRCWVIQNELVYSWLTEDTINTSPAASIIWMPLSEDKTQVVPAAHYNDVMVDGAIQTIFWILALRGMTIKNIVFMEFNLHRIDSNISWTPVHAIRIFVPCRDIHWYISFLYIITYLCCRLAICWNAIQSNLVVTRSKWHHTIHCSDRINEIRSELTHQDLGTYICVGKETFVQIAACHLFGAKPLSESMPV